MQPGPKSLKSWLSSVVSSWKTALPLPLLPHPQGAIPHLGPVYFLLRQTAAVPAEVPRPTGRPISPWQTAVLRVAKGLSVIHVAPELGADVLRRRVGTVAETQPEDLLALLVQLIEGPAAWQVCREGQGRGGGVQKTVS